MEGILFAFLGASEILETTKRVGDAEVGLLDAGEHFLVKLFLEGFGRAQDAFGVGVFGLEMLDDLAIILFAEPCVVVKAQVAMQAMLDGFACSNGRREL